jgi:hypothetical protein
MFNEIYKYLIEHYPAIAFVIALIFATGFITYKFTKLVNRFNKVEDNCQNCKVDVIPPVNTHLSNIDNSIVGIYQSLNSLLVYLKGKDQHLDVSLIKSFSPTKLTDLGNKILIEIGGKKLIDENLEVLISEMEKQDFKSGLDVQNYSSILMMNEFNGELFTPLRDYVFKHPCYIFSSDEGKTVNINLDNSTLNTVLSIYLRDKYFEKHPELNK